MVTEILSAAIANTTTSTAATQNGLDIGDITGIVALVATAIIFLEFVNQNASHGYLDRINSYWLNELLGCQFIVLHILFTK
jgi:hypothetical protein